LDNKLVETTCRKLAAQIAPLIDNLNQEISKISAQPFDIQKRDKTGKPVLTKTGLPSFHERDLFQLVNDSLQAKYPDTYQPPLTNKGQ